MKKFKTLCMLLAIAIFMSVPTVYAHEVTLDSNGIIKMPTTDGYVTGENKIEIDASYGSNYKLRYQYVEIENDTYVAYTAILNEQINYQNENKPEDSAGPEEKQAYSQKMAEYENSKQKLLPGYTANWLDSEGNTVPLDTSSIDEEKHFVLWIEVTKAGSGPIYQNKVIIFQPCDDDVTSPSTGDNTIIIGIAIVAVAGIMLVSYKKMHA